MESTPPSPKVYTGFYACKLDKSRLLKLSWGLCNFRLRYASSKTNLIFFTLSYYTKKQILGMIPLRLETIKVSGSQYTCLNYSRRWFCFSRGRWVNVLSLTALEKVPLKTHLKSQLWKVLNWTAIWNYICRWEKVALVELRLVVTYLCAKPEDS